ncbi:MAG: flagellar biosynthetic protein FliO [Lachnospiraceae bacterium]|nr:flagellar biosynthetic protein FliO [Lachnospiraceae bacterium]MBD5505843.1 flagellar biosynthetic protein FliO [Lachnospiraceae bacterium]
MILAVSGRTDYYVQFLTVLVIFVFVLMITYWVTKWTAGYQKGQTANANMEILETIRLSNNKLVQIIRVGRKYLAVAICKDTVTMLTEIPEQDLIFSDQNSNKMQGFKEILEKMQKKNFLEKEDGRDE